MRRFGHCCAVLLLAASAACVDDPSRGTLPPSPPPAPVPLGVYEISVTGVGSDDMRSTIAPARGGQGARATLTTAGAGIVFEQVSTGSFTEGTRTDGGQRYLSFTYRVRNGTGAPLSNLTLLMVSRPSTIAGTPLSSLKRFDGTAADPAIAQLVAPTGNVALKSDLATLQGQDPDVLQVLQESEVAAITPPGDITGIFPYGYVVRNAATGATSRTLPAAATANQFDGVLTLSFRVPLQASSALDAYSFTFQVLAVQDSETRLTESMEEAQDTAAVRRLRERAAALGATTVTVLAGSPAAGADVADYPGQRQICSVRISGTAASPNAYITTPAGYTRLALLRPGESASACGANFRSGTAASPTLNTPYSVTLRAMDRYGNVRTGVADTVGLAQASGPSASFGASAALASGQAAVNVTYLANGTSVLNAVGRRNRGQRTIEVATTATVVVNAGNNQAAMVGTAVPTAPSVLVRDLSNNPLAGVPVTFSVASGGGYVTSASATTNASGVATVGSWVLGSPAALNTLTATAAGASTPASFSASGCSGGGGTGYGITLCFTSTLTATQRAAFESAAARWKSIITNDLSDIAFTLGAGSCGATSPSFNLSVDDLMIFAGIEAIDGVGGILGSAGPCLFRSSGSLPILGAMRFDAADMANMESNGTFEGVIRHEMGHVLGIGVLWSPFGLLVNPSPVGGPPLDTYFSGANAITGFNNIGGSTYTGGNKVPVENTGPSGTINSHWRESVLANELMTGYANAGSMPLSQLTVRSLADLGYSVSVAQADAFFLTLSLRAAATPGPIPLGNDVANLPRYRVDENGRVTRIP
ncbi:MAG TPA: leishmanolysin-related zinc metalloendopeptidase [Longimicrobium sp.]|nr:leishmanolysin-related zinc metalloendopeptidase [Longimicrobium sp.]